MYDNFSIILSSKTCRAPIVARKQLGEATSDHSHDSFHWIHSDYGDGSIGLFLKRTFVVAHIQLDSHGGGVHSKTIYTFLEEGYILPSTTPLGDRYIVDFKMVSRSTTRSQNKAHLCATL